MRPPDSRRRFSLDETIELLVLLGVVKASIERSGTTELEFLVLRILGHKPDISVVQIAAFLHVAPGSLAGTMARLVKRGLLARRADPADPRRTVFRLVQRGTSAGAQRSAATFAAARDALEGLPQEDVQVTRRLLGVFKDALAGERRSSRAQRSGRI